MKRNQLANGALILRQCGEFVLCIFGNEYVTWRIDEQRNAFWGHYFKCRTKAEQDFNLRIGRA